MTNAHPVAHATGDEIALWRPRPWCAGLLSFLIPGLGQVYNGRPLRGVLTWLAKHLAAIALVALVLKDPFTPVKLFLLFVLAAVITGLIVWDAVRIAKRTTAHKRRVVQRWYSLTALAMVVLLVSVRPTLADVRRHIEAFRITSGSMEPTLLNGDFIFSSKYPLTSVHRADIVLVRSASGAAMYIRRVVALPGDTVSMSDDHLSIDGREVTEPYAEPGRDADRTAPEFGWQRKSLPAGVDSEQYSPTLGTWGPLVVPPNRYLLLGDARDNSYDGRYQGFAGASQLVGRPTWIYLSLDPDAGRIRWARIGHTIR